MLHEMAHFWYQSIDLVGIYCFRYTTEPKMPIWGGKRATNYESSRKSKKIHGFPWKPWTSMDFHELPWTSKEVQGLPWSSIDFHGLPWIRIAYRSKATVPKASNIIKILFQIYCKSIQNLSWKHKHGSIPSLMAWNDDFFISIDIYFKSVENLFKIY